MHLNISFLWKLLILASIYFLSIVSPGKMHIPRCHHLPMKDNQGYDPSCTINSSWVCHGNTMSHQWCPQCRWWHHSLICLPMWFSQFRLHSLRICLHQVMKTECKGKIIDSNWTVWRERGETSLLVIQFPGTAVYCQAPTRKVQTREHQEREICPAVQK